ncbi:MAG: DUF4136 domain-containing protein [bacterium]
MRKQLTAIIIFTILLFGACTSITVVSDYDKSVDFTKYKTYSYYGWAEQSDKLLSPFDKERIEKAFREEFAKRGLEYVQDGGDLTVALYIHTEDKQQTTATTTGVGGYGGRWGYGPGWGWGPGISTTTVNTYNYTMGTLVCDVFDTQQKKLIWEGVGTGEIDDNPNTREEGIPKAVAKIMQAYPLPPAK